MRFAQYVLGVVICVAGDAGLRAQTPASSPAPAPAPMMEMTVPAEGNGLATLHAYSNLIQIPALVLSMERSPVAPIKAERFSMSIDGGPVYRPTHMRMEGADPITLTIVLDFTGAAAALMPKIGEVIDRASPQGLTSRDHVSLLVMECGLFEALQDVPAAPNLLQGKISQSATAWAKRNRTFSCKDEPHLWDTLALATERLAEVPGRRVIVAVTDGTDRGSRTAPDQLKVAMQTHAITTFGIQPEQANKIVNGSDEMRMLESSLTQVTTREPFARICELSGGIVLSADRQDAGKQLARVTEMLRGRYILEFPRPDDVTAGSHKIDLRVDKSDDFVRVSGTSVPLPDPRIATDPTTLPNDPALMPKFGKSKTKPSPPPR